MGECFYNACGLVHLNRREIRRRHRAIFSIVKVVNGLCDLLLQPLLEKFSGS